MEVTIAADAVVIRFRPVELGGVLESARKVHRRIGHDELPVFADAAREGETRHQLLARLLAASEMAHMRVGSNLKYYVCPCAQSLNDEGFSFYKDDDEHEPEQHYSFDLGPDPGLEDVFRFLDVFDGPERRSS